MKVILYTIPVIVALAFPAACNGQKIINHKPMDESRMVIQETENDIKYVGNVWKYENAADPIESGYVEKSFVLMFDIRTYSKSSNEFSTHERYTIRVKNVDGEYQKQLRRESKTFYQNGENMGHVHPSGKWYTNDVLAEKVLQYYFTKKENIPVHAENIDISRWQPLFTLYKNVSDQAHVLNINLNKTYPDTGQFEIDCELLTVINVLINGELLKYSISSHTFRFVPMGKDYYVSMKHNSTKTYTNGGKNVKELTVSNQFEPIRPANETMFSKKVLEYYLENKSGFEMNRVGE